MIRTAPVLLLALGAGACRAALAPVRLDAGPPLALEALAGYRINARLKPALELTDGTVLRFDSPQVSADSAFFTATPTATAPPGVVPRGTLRVSVCAPGEGVCRLVVEQVAW